MYVAGPTILGAGKQIFDSAREQWTDENINLPQSQSLVGLRDAQVQGMRIQNEKEQREYEAGNRLVNLNDVHSRMSEIDPAYADLNRNMWQAHGVGIRTQDGGHYARAFEMAKFYDVAAKDPMWNKGSIGFMKIRATNEYTAAKEEFDKADGALMAAAGQEQDTRKQRMAKDKARERMKAAEDMLQNIATADIALSDQGWNRPAGHTVNKTQYWSPTATAERMFGRGEGTLIGNAGMDTETMKDWQTIAGKVDEANKAFWYGEGISRILADPKIVGPIRSQLSAVMGNLNTAEGLKQAENILNGLMGSSPQFKMKHGRIMEVAAQFAQTAGMQPGGSFIAPKVRVAEAFRRAEAQVASEDESSRGKLEGGALAEPDLYVPGATPGGSAPGKLGKTIPSAPSFSQAKGGAVAATRPGGLAGDTAQPKKVPEEATPPAAVAAPKGPPPKLETEKKPAEGGAAAAAGPKASYDEGLGVWVSSDGRLYWDTDAKDPNTGKRGVWNTLTPQWKKHLAYRKNANAAPGKAWDAVGGAAGRLFEIGNPK